MFHILLSLALQSSPIFNHPHTCLIIVCLPGLRFQRRHRNLGVVQQKYTEKCSPAITWLPNEQQKQLEESMRSLLESQPKQQTHDGPSSKDMLELTITMNRFMDAMEEGKKKEEKDIDKSQ